MYKGKFDQKNRQSTTDIQELLAQRNQNAAQESRPVSRPQAERPMPQPEAKRPAPQAEARRPAPQAEPRRPIVPDEPEEQPEPQRSQNAPSAPQKKRRGPRIGGLIFYTLYFLSILLVSVAMFFVINGINLPPIAQFGGLKGWLTEFEASQPTIRAQQVFEQYFTDPDWGALYDASGAQDTSFEGKEQFVAYMEARVADTPLTFLETSAGLSGDRKYVVRLGDEKVAAFTLVDRNGVGDSTLENLDKLPDWQPGTVEVFFERNESYRVVMMNGHTAYVNDKALDESHIIQIATTKAQDYLPEGTVGLSMCTQEITELFGKPNVTIFDDKGNQMEVVYDEASRTFIEQTVNNTITDEQTTTVRMAVETECLWMIAEITDRGKAAKYFDPSGSAYSFTSISRDQLWMQKNRGHEFKDFQISDFTMYTDDLFSVRVSITLSVTRTDGTVKDYPYAKSMFFQKNAKGKWLCTIATNDDISQPVGKVRLTFMNGNEKVDSGMFYTDADEIITPVLSVPEGKVFSGWMMESVDENGNDVMVLMFQPDETGRVAIPEGTALEPMVLYALFENAA